MLRYVQHVAGLLALHFSLLLAATEVQGTPQFERDVLPIFTAHCLKCHGLEGRAAGLDLRSPVLVQQGSQKGPILTTGSAKHSVLYRKIADGAMPPKGELPLRPEQIDVIGRWIDAGAPYARSYGTLTKAEAPEITSRDREHWSFRKLLRPEAPKVRSAGRVRTTVDRFIGARLGEKGLEMSLDADRATLVRRAYFDLTGLPPEPAEVDAFVADKSAQAYERLIGNLLSSPHFGERWGRSWLDAAGYVDSLGLDNDSHIIKQGEGKWRYRDYVVRSFNQDKPYDRFLVEQLAGDELVDWRSAPRFTPEIIELLTATGFLRCFADDTDQYELNTATDRYGILSQTIQTLTSNVLGITVGCAKCHSHKYDPIPQRDYYQIMAILTPALNPFDWRQPKDRALADVSIEARKEIDRWNKQVDQRAKPLRQQIAGIRKPYEERLLDRKLSLIPDALREDLRLALETPEAKRSDLQKYLATKLGPSVKVSDEEVTGSLEKDDRSRIAAIEEQIRPIEAERRKYGRLQAVYDVGPAPPSYLLRRGDHAFPAAEVQAGFLSILTEPGRAMVIPPAAKDAVTSGRRLAFARWLTDGHSPAGALAARVIVNRVWQQLFGQGIVATPDNFGRSGAKPTHPELLEWLSAEFIESGWRMKPLIRLMMTSTVYRQASFREPAGGAVDPAAIDPDNQLLWKSRLRRLESEAIRDAILTASGRLDRTMGGAPVPLESRPDGMVVIREKDLASPGSPYRRSLYLFARRNYNLSLLAAFDQPVITTNCTRRDSSAVVLQSLALTNDAFVMTEAARFADRVEREAGESVQQRIDRAFRLALGRPPRPAEAAWSEDLIRHEKALTGLCHTLFNTNEFLYVQ